MASLYNYELFTLWNHVFYAGPVILSGLIIIAIGFGHRFLAKKFLPGVYTRFSVADLSAKVLRRTLILIWIFLGLLLVLLLLGINFNFITADGSSLTLILVLEAVLIVLLAKLVDWLISNVFVHRYFTKRDSIGGRPKPAIESKDESLGFKMVSYVVYVVALRLIVANFGLDFVIYATEIKGNLFEFKISNILKAFLVVFVARLLVWVMTQLVLYTFYKRRDVDLGVQYAFNQLFSYVIYTATVLLVIQSLGINMTLFWGGAAALLVGAGLGLQQTFNDLFSGIVILFERSVKVGDILNVDGVIGRVEKIGLRSSIINSRSNISYILPNSKITTQNVINWSHQNESVRFDITVGVAYGSETDLVRKILVDVASNNQDVLNRPKPFVRFTEFGNSSLDFTLYFFSRNYLFIEDTKSDLRFEIDTAFRANDVTIPFPQRDVWFKSTK